LAELAAIGKVINTHGVKGGLKVLPLSDFPERLKALSHVFLEQGASVKEHEVTDAFVHGRFWVLFLRGIEACDSAERLIGALISIPLSERMPLPTDVYYLDQIIGLEVYTVNSVYLGRVREVLQTGSNDVYVVKDEKEGSRETLIPALKTVVQIDLRLGRILVDPPEGLL
jgi:16S rRNA processing protein RimM